MMEQILAIGAGHDIPFDLGKVVLDGKIKEFFYNQRVALVVQEDLIDRGYTVHDFEGHLSQKKIPFINLIHPILSVEIHHNANNDTATRGAETIHHPNSKKGKLLAEVVLEAIKEEGFKTNKVHEGWYRYNPKSKKFFAFTSRIKVPSIIIECAYFTNWADVKTVQQNDYPKRMGKAIARGVNWYVKTHTN